jgi:ABC-type transporter Mla subunit MlaD
VARLPTPGTVVRAAQAQTEALIALPGLLVALTGQIRGLTEAIATLQRVTARIDGITNDIEPGLRRLGRALDNPVVDDIPQTIKDFQDNVMPIARQLHETQSRIATIAEATSKLSSLPGAALFGLRRLAGEGSEQDEPLEHGNWREATRATPVPPEPLLGFDRDLDDLE